MLGGRCAPVEVGVDDVGPLRLFHAHRQSVACDARVVDENAHRFVEGIGRRREEALDALGGGHVGRHQERAARVDKLEVDACVASVCKPTARGGRSAVSDASKRSGGGGGLAVSGSGVHSRSQPVQEVASQLTRAYWAVIGANMVVVGCAGGKGGIGGGGGRGGGGGSRGGSGGGGGLARQMGEMSGDDPQDPFRLLKSTLDALSRRQPGWCGPGCAFE